MIVHCLHGIPVNTVTTRYIAYFDKVLISLLIKAKWNYFVHNNAIAWILFSGDHMWRDLPDSDS